MVRLSASRVRKSKMRLDDVWVLTTLRIVRRIEYLILRLDKHCHALFWYVNRKFILSGRFDDFKQIIIEREQWRNEATLFSRQQTTNEFQRWHKVSTPKQ